MEVLFPSLFSKAFFVLGVQLVITWAATVLSLSFVHRLHAKKVSWISSSTNDNGQIDLKIDFQFIKPYFYGLLIFDTLIFLLLLFWGTHQPLSVSMSLFAVWSITTGIMLALCLIEVDENLGAKVLSITALIVFATFAVGVYTKIDFGFLGGFLFIALCGLILFSLVRIFSSMPRATERWISGIGVVIFTLYLIYDFNRLAKLEAAGINDWHTAVRISISIYLDIINLFLDLLDAMSN